MSGAFSSAFSSAFDIGSGSAAVTCDIASLIPVPISSVSASVGVTGDINSTIPAPISSVSASVVITADISASIPAPTSIISAYISNIADINSTIPAPASAVAVAVGESVDISASIPAPISTVSASVYVYCDVNSIIPVPTVNLSGAVGTSAYINAGVNFGFVEGGTQDYDSFDAAIFWNGNFANGIPVPTSLISANGTLVCSIASSIPAPTSTIGSLAGESADISASIPAPVSIINAKGFTTPTGNINSVTPSVTCSFTAHVHKTWEETILSQYANSPTILRLIENFANDIDPGLNINNFYNYVWNINTAQGYGLDVWGRIVGIGRVIKISGGKYLGFTEGGNIDYDPFNQSQFWNGDFATTNFTLTDDSYRLLIMVKAMANICRRSIPEINSLLMRLFPNRGNCYITDTGGMAARYNFEFILTATELAILEQSEAIFRPTGVKLNVLSLDIVNTFGFSEAGSSAQPFNCGIFFVQTYDAA